MELLLTVIRYQNRPPQRPLTARIGITGGTIGRGPENELVLADPERWVGRQHARIVFREGAFYLTDTSKNGTFVSSAAEPLHEGQEIELHDNDELGIGSYEVRVSLAASQPQSTAPADPFAGGKPALDSYAQLPSGRTAPDILDLAAGTSTAGDPFSSPAAGQKTPTGPDDWLISGSPEKGPGTFGIGREPAGAPASPTAPDHTPDANACYSPPAAIPEDYDILADASRPTPIADAPESPAAPAIPGTDPLAGGPESPIAPTASEPVPLAGGPEPPTAATAPGTDPLAGGPEPPIAPTASEPVPLAGGPKPPTAATALGTDLLAGGPEPPAAATALGMDPLAGGPESTSAPIVPDPARFTEQSAPAPAPPAAARTGETPRPTPSATGETDAIQAFLAGLDVGALPADPQAQTVLMQTVGLLLRAMTEGLMRVLMGRTSFKNELHLEMTTIQSRENNPFKFSVDPEDALTHLLFRSSRGFLPPLEAAREAFDDIQRHEMAMVAGLRAALHALLKRMDPAELENRFQARSVLDNLMPLARKAKYWDLFTATYQEISADAADDFLNLFRDAFTRAYEDQAARLRQTGPRDNT
ncbi:MAG: type VI secretion system-associated FHA domain protein TagH [Candidatus Thiosymbion ectosymbiont of Robbea hypermnestra]|nr:type VI secretion system-associated FHA domain protein TagH [Candidatus Thiosymbion ectosymbiont of Robbea hypermnestra]